MPQEFVNTNLSSRYLDASGASSRVQLVPSLSPPNGNGNIHDIYSSHRRANALQNAHHSLSNSSFGQNMERYYRESRSDFDLYNNNLGGIDYRYHTSIPYRSRSTLSNGNNYRGYGTIDHSSLNYDANRQRRSLPKSFSDCDLCKRHATSEEYPQYFNVQDDNWHIENTIEQRTEPRAYRDKIKERFRERSGVRQLADNEATSSPMATVEYSTVLPRHQRISSESNRSNGPVHHLPFEYIPSETLNNIRTTGFKRNLSKDRLAAANNQQHMTDAETNTNDLTMKYYERDDDVDDVDSKNNFDRRLNESREVQEMSMRMNEQQNLNRQEHYCQQHQRRFTGNNGDV